MDMNKPIPLSRHAEIVQSIYREQEMVLRQWRIITGRQESDGHRYEGERCVWCGVNYLDRLNLIPEELECVGPGEGDWSDDWWPLEKVDALLDAHRAEVRERKGLPY